jgi:hypothetical protein
LRPYSEAWIASTRGAVALLNGHWEQAEHHNRVAEEAFRTQCTGVAWETALVRQNTRWALCFLGRLSEVGQQVASALRDARERDDLFATIGARSGFPNIVWLVNDDVERARRETIEAIARWSQAGFHLQHLFDLIAQVNVDLYMQDGQAAHTRVEAAWPKLAKSGLLTVRFNRVLAFDMRARAALACAQKGAAPESARLRSAARADAKRLRKERQGWAEALADNLDACAAEGGAIETVWSAVAERFEACKMALHAAAARAQLSQERRAQAHQWLEAQGTKRPERLLGIFTPVGR